MSEPKRSIGCWDVFEAAFTAATSGNPFTDVRFAATFQFEHRKVTVDGFYDGDDTFRVRFMPDGEGEWSYVTHSDVAELNGRTGSFVCVPPDEGNHGPVRVTDTWHFAYADGAPYYQVGTTCYAWVHQGDLMEEQTLTTLATAPFNKLRMCVFPKSYRYSENEPVYYPFARDESGEWDFTRPDPAFWQHFERRVAQLRDLGIEADLILFHPYDRWGFARMDAASDDRYLRYAVARLAAYRNVWWSLANEYDLMKDKTMADWDRFFRIIWEQDPYQHLRSVHNCRGFYDYGKPWVTHCSIQHSDLGRVPEWRETYRKPVVVDECRYEGNIEERWGNLSGGRMTHQFWQGAIGGGYVGHGETYRHPQDLLWWSKGGRLHGGSPDRIAFLRQLLEDGPPVGFTPLKGWHPLGAGKGEEYYLFYFGDSQPAEFTFHMPPGRKYAAEIIDPLEMTITSVPGLHEGTFALSLPGRENMAVRLQLAGP